MNLLWLTQIADRRIRWFREELTLSVRRTTQHTCPHVRLKWGPGEKKPAIRLAIFPVHPPPHTPSKGQYGTKGADKNQSARVSFSRFSQAFQQSGIV
jgi:hypothetical protein